MTIEPELLSVREVCKLISIGKTTIYRDCAAGRVPRPVRIGKKKRWRRRELLDWIAAGTPALNRWTWRGDSEKKQIAS